MANITDQFVTSFSELYYSTAPAVGTTENEIRSWFSNTGATAIQKRVAITIADTIVIGDVFTAVVDGISFSFTAAATTVASVATGLAAAIDTIGRFDASATLGVITVNGVAGTDAGDYSVVLSTDSSAGTITTPATPAIAFVAATGTNLVPLVMEIGTLSNEATVIDTPTFGEVYRGKLRGQLDGGQLDAQLYWAPRNPLHQELRSLAESGAQIYVGIKWNSDANATDSEFVYFDSFVSSFGIDTTFDDVAKVACTFVVDGAEHFASAS